MLQTINDSVLVEVLIGVFFFVLFIGLAVCCGMAIIGYRGSLFGIIKKPKPVEDMDLEESQIYSELIGY